MFTSLYHTLYLWRFVEIGTSPSFVPSSVPSDIQIGSPSFASPLDPSGLSYTIPSSVISKVPLNMLSTFHTIPSYGTSQGPSDGPSDRL